MNTALCRRVLLAAAVMAAAATASARDFWAYFGTYTNALSQGIYVSKLDADTGKFSPPELAAVTPSPCYLALSPGQKHLYTSDSVRMFDGQNVGSVSAFAVDRATGKLTPLNRKSSGGVGPCYVSVDATGKVLLTANYTDGSFKSFKIAPDGSIGTDGTVFRDVGSSVNTNRQLSAHAHFIMADPGNRFALICDLGMDKVMIYQLDVADGLLTLTNLFYRSEPSDSNLSVSNKVGYAIMASGSVPPGSGSRHLAFSKDGKFAYVVNEMGCSVTTFTWDGKKGSLTPVETISALPSDSPVQTSYTGAEILVHPSGKYVYATVRGHNSVSVFAATKKTGHLTLIQNIPCGGNFPRGLGIDPTGHWLVTGNQKSDNAAVFAIDTKTGKLAPTGQSLTIGSPVDVKFVAVK